MLQIHKLAISLAACASVVACAPDDIKPETAPLDTEAPVVTLNGESSVTITLGTSFTDPGATVTDNVDTDLTATVSGSVNTNEAGEYILVYAAEDSAGNAGSATRTVTVEETITNEYTGDAYLFHTSNDDTFYMQYWGDTWATGTVYTDEPTNPTYSKELEIQKSSDWGTVVAWGNEPENAIDIAQFEVAKFKLKSDTFSQVQVFVQSRTESESNTTYNVSSGIELSDGWIEMQVDLPDFNDMTWFALNFIGDSGTVNLADVYFTLRTEEAVVPAPPAAAPVPTAADNDVIGLYSDTLTQDSWISLWSKDWWNMPIHAEGELNGDHFARYEITAGGTAGGVVGLEFGYDKDPINAATKSTWNLDLLAESGITKIILQLVSEDGASGSYTITAPVTDEWVSYAIDFEDITDNNVSSPLNTGALSAIGIQLWGNAGDALFVDNIYFSGVSDLYALTVTVQDAMANPIENASVSAGGDSGTTDVNGDITLNVPLGDHKIRVEAGGYGVTEQSANVSATASETISLALLNAGPATTAPVPTETDAEAVVLYSDALLVDRAISYWSDNWWNAPEFSEVQVGSDNIAKFQIIPAGTAGGVTGIQYGIANDEVLDATGATRVRFDMFLTEGITQVTFQVVSSAGAGVYTVNNAVNPQWLTTDQWVTFDIAFNEMNNPQNILVSELTQLGVQLWGTTSDAIYLDNIYFY